MQPVLVAALLLIALPAAAQHTPHGRHGAVSPYAGEEVPAIKSLSADDIAELRRGGGWGLARVAELNGVPGPAHLLALADEIPLTGEQVEAIEAIFNDMRARAIAAGERLITSEAALETVFREGTVTDEALRRLLDNIEVRRRELRYIHLSAHLTTPALLSEDQIARYNALRGYGSDACAAAPEGHDPVMWRRHNRCN